MIKLTLKTSDGTEVFDKDDLLYIKAEGNYCRFYFKDNKNILISKCIGKFSSLEEYGFIRPNRSEIVNVNKIHRFTSGAIWIANQIFTVSRNIDIEELIYKNQIYPCEN